MNQELRLENTFFFLVENTLATSIVLPDSVKNREIEFKKEVFLFHDFFTITRKNIKNRADIGHL